MDGDRFDELSKLLGTAISRQRMVRLLGGLAAVGVPVSVGFDLEALADGKRKKGKGKRRKRRKRRAGCANGELCLPPICNPASDKKVAMCHCPPGNPANAHVVCISPSGCNGHDNDLPCDCVCGDVPAGCDDGQGQPFPQCPAGRCRPDGACAPTGQTCAGACDLNDFPCPQPPITNVTNCRCQVDAVANSGTCVDCPSNQVCGLACCPDGQICCDGVCTDASGFCGGICGNVCGDSETCCGTDCVPSNDLCPDCENICTGSEVCCGTTCVPSVDLCPDCQNICTGNEVCCGNACVTGVECCLAEQCDERVCETAACNNGTCDYTPVTPNQQGPLCDGSGEVCCLNGRVPECCQNGDVCTATGCCTPLTCAAFPGRCGQQDAGCGVTINCDCADGLFCNAAGECITPTCTPDPIEVACAGRNCGPASDGCGQDYDCGACVGSKKHKKACLDGVCKAAGGKRCIGSGLAGQPCGGKKCKCRGGRRCHNGKCCEPSGDGSVHCTANNDCCPGLMCARRRPGQHKVCISKTAKDDLGTTDETAVATPSLALGAILTGLAALRGRSNAT